MLLPSLQALLGKECRQNVTFDGSRRENIPARRARHRRGVADKSFARHNERFLRPATTTCIDESTIFAASTICLLLQPRVIARGERVNQTRTHRERCNCALRGGWKTPGDFPLTCSSSAVPGFPSPSSRHGESPRRFSGREIYSMARGGRGGEQRFQSLVLERSHCHFMLARSRIDRSPEMVIKNGTENMHVASRRILRQFLSRM